LLRLSRARRARRTGEWTERDAVTFIVTLAALRNVTLAARASGMSRKSAYALRARDPAFAEAWEAAYRAGSQLERRLAPRPPVGDKADETDTPPSPPRHGDSARPDYDIRWFHGRRAQKRGESARPPLAAGQALP